MKRISGFIIAVLVVLFAVVLVAGCTGSPSANTTTVQPSATTTASSSAALYSAGDIVRSPKAGVDTGYLILRYDAGSDTYERAFIYRNSDGSWGYRIDSSSVTIARSAFEKVYSVKITNVDPAGVPLTRPSATSAVPTATYNSGTTTTPTASTTLAMKPQITDITPDNGFVGSTVTFTDLHGNGFQTGATVILARFGSTNISATDVNTLSAQQISGKFALPADATIGIWDLIVTNPDGQSLRYSNVFTVRENPSTTTTTTTTSSTGAIGITSIDPTFTSAGYLPLTVIGSNFKDGLTCTITKSGSVDILASTVLRSSEQQMQCFFTIPIGSGGSWNLVVKNTDGTTGTLTNGLTVNG